MKCTASLEDILLSRRTASMVPRSWLKWSWIRISAQKSMGCLLHNIQNVSGGPPISYSVGNGGVSPLVSDRLALPSLRMIGSIHLHPKYAFMMCVGNILLKYINPLKTGGGMGMQRKALHLLVMGEWIIKVHSSESFQAAPACPSGKCRLETC